MDTSTISCNVLAFRFVSIRSIRYLVVVVVVVVLVVLLTAFAVPVEPYFAVGFAHYELEIVDVAVPLVALVPVLGILSMLAVTHYAVTTVHVTRPHVVNPVDVSVHP